MENLSLKTKVKYIKQYLKALNLIIIVDYPRFDLYYRTDEKIKLFLDYLKILNVVICNWFEVDINYLCTKYYITIVDNSIDEVLKIEVKMLYVFNPNSGKKECHQCILF